MKEGWEYKKLGDAATFINGFAFKPTQWGKSGIPIIRIQNLNNPVAPFNYFDGDIPIKYLVKKGDILISWSASLGAYEWTGENAYLNQHIFKVIFDKADIDKHFLKYAVTSKLSEMDKDAHGATMRHIVKKDFDNTIIPFPPLSEQQHIVEELDLLSSIIEKKKAQLKELDNLAQSLFYEMFGDPITNEKGWEVKPLGKECTELKYGTSKPACENGKYKYLRMGNLTINGELDLSSLKTIDIPDDEVEKCVVRYGDILFNRTNSLDLIGKTCMFNLDEPMVIAGYIIRVRLSLNLNPRYISAMFNMPRMKLLLKKMAKGAVNQANINSKELASILTPIPPLDLQQQFASKIEVIEHQKELIKQSIKEVETLFNSRMDYYFN